MSMSLRRLHRTAGPDPAEQVASFPSLRMGEDPPWVPGISENLQVSVRNLGSRPTLTLQGELDIAAVAAFELRLNELERSNPPAIVLDLSRLRFLDCSGLHSFVAAERRIRSSGGRLLVVAGPAHVQRLFELTRTENLFDFVDPDRL